MTVTRLAIVTDPELAASYLDELGLDPEIDTADISAVILEPNATHAGNCGVLLVCKSGTVLARTTLHLLASAIKMLSTVAQASTCQPTTPTETPNDDDSNA